MLTNLTNVIMIPPGGSPSAKCYVVRRKFESIGGRIMYESPLHPHQVWLIGKWENAKMGRLKQTYMEKLLCKAADHVALEKAKTGEIPVNDIRMMIGSIRAGIFHGYKNPNDAKAAAQKLYAMDIMERDDSALSYIVMVAEGEGIMVEGESAGEDVPGGPSVGFTRLKLIEEYNG